MDGFGGEKELLIGGGDPISGDIVESLSAGGGDIDRSRDSGSEFFLGAGAGGGERKLLFVAGKTIEVGEHGSEDHAGSFGEGRNGEDPVSKEFN